MADKHPYISGAGNVAQAINHFRSSFPPTINADTLKKLGLAPNNESYLINILKCLGIIDNDGNKTEKAAIVFSKHSDKDFQTAFSEIVKNAYSDLFKLYGDDAWSLGKDELITYFRSTDQTSAVIGGRQAATFQVLAGTCGHRDITEPKAKKAKSSSRPKKLTSKTENITENQASVMSNSKIRSGAADFALTVRVEVNLPADADQETYDRIFKSIRDHLINGE